KFANTVRATNPRTYLLRRIRRSVALFVLGLVMLLVGVVLNTVAAALTVTLGVLGFVIMLTAGLRGWSDLRRMSGRTVEGPRRGQSSRRSEKTPMMERFEQRWNRRWEDRGDH
nr:DUF3040 domain-containing protein [Micromonospora sp. DSM 115978]